MEKRTFKEAVEIMVDWWVQKSFHTPANQNNGDESESGSMTFMLMNLASNNAQQDITADKILKFKSKLTAALLHKEKDNRFSTRLSVDYNPNQILFEACEHAGINTICLPCKTFTAINKENEIEGRYQYGSDFFTI